MNLGCFFKGLPRKDSGSRLLITGCSQSFYLAETLGKAYNIHVVKALDSNRSWQLFLRTIDCARGNNFTDEQEFPKQLERKGKEMLSTCGGVPSAIKEVAKQLVEKKRSGIEWEKLLESVDLGESTTMESLESSYHKLDPDTKLCFLHLALFKENTTIKREKLIHIWSAGGRASESDIKFAYYTLERLTKESMIEVQDYPMRSFRVNSLLHRLSIKKAEQKMGFEILSNNGNNRPSQRPRHPVICCSREKFDYTTNHDKNLVSLFFRGGGHLDVSTSYWESLKLLRILELEEFGLNVLSQAIGTLVKLRYLGLRNNHIQELPNSFGCLKKLEVPDIALNFMVEVPDIIWKMDSLRHLYMYDVICQKPLKIDALQNLETLTYISVDDWTYEPTALETMATLKKLGIEEIDGNSDASELFASLSKLKRLDYLILRGFLFKRMPCLDDLGILRRITKLKLDGLLPTLPSANNLPPKLTYLKLVNSRLDQDPMAVLEKLPKLKYLKLRNAYTGRRMAILREGFPQLHVLCMEELWNLRNVEVGEGAMPRIRKLEINNCPYLETLPEDIGSVEELKMLTSKKIATKIRKLGLMSRIRIVDINI